MANSFAYTAAHRATIGNATSKGLLFDPGFINTDHIKEAIDAIMTTTDADGKLKNVTSIAIGTASADKILHVYKGASGFSGTVGFSQTIAVFEGGVAGANTVLISPNTDTSQYHYFGDQDSAGIGGIGYDHSVNDLFLRANNLVPFRIDGNGNVIAGAGAVATTATNGFLYIPTCAGTPTGVPTGKTGRSAVIYDTTNNKFLVYDGGWVSIN